MLRPRAIMGTAREKEPEMDDKTKAMIREWVTKDGGDTERTARWISRLPMGIGLKDARNLGTEAVAS